MTGFPWEDPIPELKAESDPKDLLNLYSEIDVVQL
jgi:hypothetical protein